MIMTAAAKRRAKLERRHEAYRHYQEEAETDVFMAMNGHPYAEQYLQARAYFDTLKYASNQGTRFVAYKDEWENVECHEPDLRVRIPGLYPGMGDPWEEAVRKIVETQDWGECSPSIELGSWSVYTKSRRLVADLFVLTGNAPEAFDAHRHPGVWVWHGNPLTLEMHEQFRKIVKRRVGRWLLPERTEEDDLPDREPTPLAEREIVYCGVDQVVVGPHEIRVPQIPLDGTGNQVVRSTIFALLPLCDRGYPWEKVRGYCEKWVTKKWLREQDREQKRKAKERAAEAKAQAT